MHKENEIKILITLAEYNRLNQLFNWCKDYYQVNYYYGNVVSIEKKTSTYRVREKNGKIKLQVKIPEKYDGSLHVKKEYEKEITDIPPKLRKEDLTEITGIFFAEDIDYLGKLTTYRKKCLDYEDVVICLDKNHYLDKTDYEIEIEFEGDYPKEITLLLEEYGIKTDECVQGKNTRYLKELLKIRGET